MSLEKKAKRNLLLLIDEFQRADGISDAMLSKCIYGDASWFIKRLREGDSRSFSVKKYDEIVTWFEDHWPYDADWPPEVEKIDRGEQSVSSTLIKRHRWKPLRLPSK